MIMKKEAKQIQEMNQDADTQCVKSLCTSDKKRLESSQSVKWHLCVSCEAEQTGRTQDQVMDSTFKKQKEHKLNRVKQHKAFLLKREKRMEAKGKAPAMVAKDVKAHNDLVPKLKESSVEDDKVTLSEDSGEEASTPEVHYYTRRDPNMSVTYEGDWEELRRTLPDPEDPLVAMDINKVLFEAKAQDSYIPASSYQEEPVSSKDSTCSCNSSLQTLAACFTCCVVRV